MAGSGARWSVAGAAERLIRGPLQVRLVPGQGEAKTGDAQLDGLAPSVSRLIESLGYEPVPSSNRSDLSGSTSQSRARPAKGDAVRRVGGSRLVEKSVDPYGEEVALLTRSRRRITISFDAKLELLPADYVIHRPGELQCARYDLAHLGTPFVPCRQDR